MQNSSFLPAAGIWYNPLMQNIFSEGQHNTALSQSPAILPLILAGGKGSRFGGQKKGLLQAGGKPFILQITDTFKNAGFDEVLLSVDREDPYAFLQLPMVPDRYPECGPLGGIASAMESTAAGAYFTVACDMPFIRAEAIHKLLDQYMESGGIVLASDGADFEPLFGIYPRFVLPEAKALLSEGICKTRQLFKRCGGTLVTFPGSELSFRNINTAEDYLHYLGQKTPL